MRGDRHPNPSQFWLNSYNLSFRDIVDKSNCSRKHVEYHYVLSNDKIKNSILKPVNDYVYNLYPAPELIKYEDGYIYLRQRTHAEIWVKRDYRLGFYFLDRPHIRQFYTSDKIIKAENTFMVPYRFYSPWFIDLEGDFEVLQVKDEYCPFIIEESTHSKIDTNLNILEPTFINFLFKKTGEHMLNPVHGKISIGTPMFDIKKQVTELEYQRFEKFYREYKYTRF